MPSGQWRPHENRRKFEISASKCQDRKCILDQIYWKTRRALPRQGPQGPQIDFFILKSHGGTTWSPGIISITIGPLCACMLFWFTYVMEGLLFPICKWCFSCRTIVFEVISPSVFGSNIVLVGGGRGLKFWNVIFTRNHPWIARRRQF